MKRRTIHVAFVLALLLLAFGTPLSAQNQEQPAITSFFSSSTVFPGGQFDQTHGYEFTVLNADIVVTALGHYDYESDGLVSATPVGIWTTTGQLLASVTVPSGTAALLIVPGDTPRGGYRYASLNAPLTLNANTTYVIGSLPGPNDPRQNLADNIVQNPGISVGGRRLSFTNAGFVFPALTGDSRPAIEDNFLIQTPLPLQVIIDIKPGSDPNSINLDSRGRVPVAVLTTADFDASSIDPATVTFAGASPLTWAWEDVDADGDLDLLFHFKTMELDLVGATSATLSGTTIGGTSIQGTDTVNIMP